MESSELKNYGVEELCPADYKDNNGGFMMLMMAWSVGSTAFVMYGAFMAGYDAATR